MQKTKNVISLSQNAANRINDLVNKAENKVIGLRVGIKSSGCSGFKYNVEYAYEEKNLEEKIIELHPYECPAILRIPIEGGHKDFLNWIKEQVSN